MQKMFDTCTVLGCDRPHKARGYCQTHYMQVKRGAPITEQINTRVREKPPECTEAGCCEPVKSKGLCQMHYQRYLRHGYTGHRDRSKPFGNCSVEGCDSVMYSGKMCHAHYIKDLRWKSKGLSLSDYGDKLAAQNFVCEICEEGEKTADWRSGKTKALAIDHCHETDKIRGLLCSSCNRALGLFQDSPELLRKAADYLDRHAEPSFDKTPEISEI